METNLAPNFTLLIYDIAADDFGDTSAIGEPAEVGALVEDTQTFDHADNADFDNGVVTAMIWPDDATYVAKNGRLQGLLAQFKRLGTVDSRSWYRVASVHPGESLVDAEPDLVELVMQRIETPAVEDES